MSFLFQDQNVGLYVYFCVLLFSGSMRINVRFPFLKFACVPLCDEMKWKYGN